MGYLVACVWVNQMVWTRSLRLKVIGFTRFSLINFMNLCCTIVCPLTQIWHLESTLLYDIRKGKDGSNGQCKLLVCQRKQNWKLSSRSYKRAIRSTSIIIRVYWWLGKQLRIIFKKRMKKNWSIHVDFGLRYKSTSLVCELKKEDLVLEAQINFLYDNFPNMPTKRKRPRPRFIDLNKFWWKKKKKQRMTCTNTIKTPNIHNPFDGTDKLNFLRWSHQMYSSTSAQHGQTQESH